MNKLSDLRFDFHKSLCHTRSRIYSNVFSTNKKKGVSSHQKTRLVIGAVVLDQCFQCVPSQPWKECNRSEPVTLSRFQQPSLTNSFFMASLLQRRLKLNAILEGRRSEKRDIRLNKMHHKMSQLPLLPLGGGTKICLRDLWHGTFATKRSIHR
ncbi:hypothetical protein TNCV_71271 [Trichonephila clavipes]|nr:hypothetical protein TNCV_71271 [Trichonephila clavipes]